MPHEPSSHRRPPRREHPLLAAALLVLLAAVAALVSTDAARAEFCMQSRLGSAAEPSTTGGGVEAVVACGRSIEEPPPPQPAPQPSPGGGDGSSCSGVVILYEHTNLEGRCWGFAAGETGWVGDAANDQASSVWVSEGYVVTLFLHAWFDGPAHSTLTMFEPWGWVDIGNDNVSSLVVQPSEPVRSYYGGEDATAESAAYDLTSLPASGCGRVGASVARRGAGGRQWEYGLVASFCWNGTTVTAVWRAR